MSRILERVRILCPPIALLLVSGCAGDSFQKPVDFDLRPLRERAEVLVKDGIQVSTAVPSREDSVAIFGIDLSTKGIQPVWIEVENDSDSGLYFLRTGMDPEYFAPREVSFAFRGALSEESARRLDRHLEALSFRNPIRPSSTVSGFVYTYTDLGSKFVTVDLLGDGWSRHFTLTPAVPGDSLAEQQISKLRTLADAMVPRHVRTESELRQVLEQLPCCASDEHGTQAEPLNVVVIGNTSATAPALLRRHFRISTASPLHAFGRVQDLTLKKSSGWVAAQPHVLRVWLTDILYRDKPVWIGHISTPLGGRFAGTDETRIDPNVDGARLDLVQDAMYSQFLSKMGFVKGVGTVPDTRPRTIPNGSNYYTDGLRAVLVFRETPLSLDEIGFLDWERLVDHYAGGRAEKSHVSFR